MAIGKKPETSTKITELIALQLLQKQGALSIFDKSKRQKLRELDLEALSQRIVSLADDEKKEKITKSPSAKEVEDELAREFFETGRSVTWVRESTREGGNNWLDDTPKRVTRNLQKMFRVFDSLAKGDNTPAIEHLLDHARFNESVVNTVGNPDTTKREYHGKALEDIRKAAVLAQDKKV